MKRSPAKVKFKTDLVGSNATATGKTANRRAEIVASANQRTSLRSPQGFTEEL